MHGDGEDVLAGHEERGVDGNMLCFLGIGRADTAGGLVRDKGGGGVGDGSLGHVAPGDFDAVEIGDEAIVVIDGHGEDFDGRGVIHHEDVPQEQRVIAVAHVGDLGAGIMRVVAVMIGLGPGGAENAAVVVAGVLP